MIYTSLAEIKSFSPCGEGWRNILNGQGKTEADDVLFPLTEAVESNSISDVCWLLGKRKKEIEVCARFAAMCADSVKHLKNKNTLQAATYATYAAAAAADAATYAATYAAYAADAAAYAAAFDEQKEKNKQFLIQCITEWKGE
jgi:predicted CopG family antitoxin